MKKQSKEIITDYVRAVEISHRSIAMMREKVFPFNKPNLFPDAIVPEGISSGSLEHALYHFHSVSIDSMREAQQVYIAMRALASYLDNDFSQLSKMSRKDLEKVLLPNLGKGIKNPRSSMTDPVGTLLENAQRLDAEYKGDPRLLLSGKNVWETLYAIDEFRQYGIPKAALLMKNFVKAGVWPLSPFDIPIKVDRHVLRISLSRGVISALDYAADIDWAKQLPKALVVAREQLIRIGNYNQEDFEKGNVKLVRGDKFVLPLTRTYMSVTQRERISAIDLDDATRAIGAYLCKMNDGVSCALSCQMNCETRYPSDNNAVWFFLDVDKRKDPTNLFSVRN